MEEYTYKDGASSNKHDMDGIHRCYSSCKPSSSTGPGEIRSLQYVAFYEKCSLNNP